jgi:OmcA/MtrC family decaheme c-type cytochrome
MRSCGNRLGSKLRRGLFIASLGIAGLAFGCSGSDGDPGPQGPPGPPGGAGDTATILDPSQDPPGVVIAITGVSGATGSGGTFQAGDALTVTFTIKKRDGSSWKLSEMGVGAILASGPTSNYTRVLKEKVNVVSHATENADGSYSYQFEDPIPADYEPPINDSGSYGAADGNLAGTPLQTGTYTVGMYLGWFYTVNGKPFSDVGNATFDFLYGAGAVLDTREVVTQANCNACHGTLRVHGGFLRDVKMCTLCHTVGAEDFAGPPGAHLWFPVVLHKVHDG